MGSGRRGRWVGECGYWCWCGLSQCEYLCESLILSVHIIICVCCLHTHIQLYTNGSVVLHTELCDMYTYWVLCLQLHACFHPSLLLYFLIRFTIGNTKTLAIPGIRDQVIAYYNKRYSSNLVSSCMQCSMLLYCMLQYSYTVLT